MEYKLHLIYFIYLISRAALSYVLKYFLLRAITDLADIIEFLIIDLRSHDLNKLN